MSQWFGGEMGHFSRSTSIDKAIAFTGDVSLSTLQVRSRRASACQMKPRESPFMALPRQANVDSSLNCERSEKTLDVGTRFYPIRCLEDDIVSAEMVVYYLQTLATRARQGTGREQEIYPSNGQSLHSMQESSASMASANTAARHGPWNLPV